jgi:hypothetical protein
MSNKFYSIYGEADILSEKIKKYSKDCVEKVKPIYVPELKITVFPKVNETKEQTIQRYLNKSITFKNKQK